MSRALLQDPVAERRLQELERLARARLAGLLAAGRKGTVVVRIEVERGQVTWHSGVTLEERPLDREEGLTAGEDRAHTLRRQT